MKTVTVTVTVPATVTVPVSATKKRTYFVFNFLNLIAVSTFLVYKGKSAF